jgi:hypothetical protein
MAAGEQLADHPAPDEPGRTGHENAHGQAPWATSMSTSNASASTARTSDADIGGGVSERYAPMGEWGASAYAASTSGWAWSSHSAP